MTQHWPSNDWPPDDETAAAWAYSKAEEETEAMSDVSKMSDEELIALARSEGMSTADELASRLDAALKRDRENLEALEETLRRIPPDCALGAQRVLESRLAALAREVR